MRCVILGVVGGLWGRVRMGVMCIGNCVRGVGRRESGVGGGISSRLICLIICVESEYAHVYDGDKDYIEKCG